MINISEKYREQLTAMMADAAANREEAANVLESRRKEHEECDKHLNDIYDVVRSMQRKFFSVIGTMLKLAFSKPNPDAAKAAIETCQTYADAAAQIPESVDALKRSEEAMESALADVAAHEDFAKASEEFMEKLSKLP